MPDEKSHMRIIFVCLGNICRSPMAEFIFKKLADGRGLSDMLEVSSRATSDEESGNPIYPPAARALAAHGVYGEHRARKLTREEAATADLIVGMDESNIRNISRICGGMYSDKIRRLCDFTARPRDVADPWYTRDFEKAYEDISDGCSALLDYAERLLGKSGE